MIALIKDNQVTLCRFQRRNASGLAFEIRDLNELEGEYREEVIDTTRQILQEGEFLGDDIRLLSSYKRKVCNELLEQLIFLKPFYKYWHEEPQIRQLSVTSPQSIPYLYSELNVLQMALDSVTLVPPDKDSELYNIAMQNPTITKGSKNNALVLQLTNHFARKKTSW